MFEEQGTDNPELWEEVVITVICLLVFGAIIVIMRKALVAG